MMAWGIILTATALLHVVYGQTVRPCVDFMDIPNVALRNPSVPTQPANTINDRTLRSGWYGLANYELHDSAPGFLRCGSLYPIWLQSISGNTANMCIQETSNTCANTFTIQVADCNGYTVYNLTDSPVHQTSYCFREIPPNRPTYSPKPTVSAGVTDTGFDKSDLYFRCSFPPSSSQRLFHQTTWYVDNVLIHQHPPMLMDDTYVNNTQITQAMLVAAGITKVGFNISCEVHALFGVGMPIGPANRADPFFVGFEILTEEITIRQGQTGQVQVRATVPFRCGNITETFSTICTMPVEIQSADSAGRVSQEDCEVSIPYTRWNNPVSMTVHGTITPTYGRNQLDSVLVLRTPIISPRFPFWTNHTIGTVKVKVVKDTTLARSKRCSSRNDPYVYAFDGGWYSLQQEGRYTLYKLTRQLIEIQIAVRRCARTQGFCNCGVAFRSGKTVFSINGCDSMSWRQNHQGCDNSFNAMEIRKYFRSYEIFLPTGARVTVSLRNSGTRNMFMNVYIPGTIQDVNASRGLCGRLSNTRNDDFIMRNEMRPRSINEFFDSWRVTTEDLFDPDYVTTLTRTSPQPPKYCFCEGGRNITCSSLSTMNSEVKLEHYKDVPCVVRQNRKKRAVQDRHVSTGHRYKRQAASEVWTNQTAAEFCNNLFAASRTVQQCRNVPGVNVDNSRDDCIRDILLSGTTDFQMMSIDTVRSSCETEVLLNPDLWVPDPNNPGAPSVFDTITNSVCPSDCSGRGSCQRVDAGYESYPGAASVFDTITNNVCPRDCNGRGTCQRGQCVCSAGFGGADCSVDLTQPPQLDEVEDDGHCDLATSTCQRLTVFGQTFLEDMTIRCRYTKFTVSNDGSLHQPNTQVTVAIERSLSEVECPVGVDTDRVIVTAYNISVANTDNIYSEDATVLVYDSTCVSVDHGSRNWVVRNGFRVEKGKCISNDGPRPTGRSTPASTPAPTPASTPMIDVTGPGVVVETTTNASYKTTMSCFTLLASLMSCLISLLNDF